MYPAGPPVPQNANNTHSAVTAAQLWGCSISPSCARTRPAVHRPGTTMDGQPRACARLAAQPTTHPPSIMASEYHSKI